MRALSGSLVRSLFLRVWQVVRAWAPWLIAVALLLLFVRAINPRTLLAAAGQIQWIFCLPIAGAFLLYLFLRALRWHLLLRPLQVPNTLLDSLLLFTGAQAATLVPGGQFLLPSSKNPSMEP